MIHATALIDEQAKLSPEVRVGAYSVIEGDVVIGKNTAIAAHVVIRGPCRIGSCNQFFPFSAIGGEAQIKENPDDTESFLEIGDSNVIRECVTISRGSTRGTGRTIIGNNNLIMAYAHIAHDCIVGSDNTFTNAVGLAGHVHVEDHVNFGAYSGAHQFCRVGRFSFIAANSMITQDVPPYCLAHGDHARFCGINREGLRRHQFSDTTVEQIKRAYRLLYREQLSLQEALSRLQEIALTSKEVARIIHFLEGSTARGFIRFR